MSASFAIVNDLIEEKSGTGVILDFEGSMNENIARFFRGFGATEEVYFEVRKSFR